MSDSGHVGSITPLPKPAPEVVFCEVEDGAVLLSTAQEIYFGLNGVGARIWALLPPAHDSLEGLCEGLSKDFPDVDAAMLRADVLELLAELKQHGLVN